MASPLICQLFLRSACLAVTPLGLSNLRAQEYNPVPPAAAVDAWLTDWEAAKKQAASEDKGLLIDFTGSDWCAWCIRLRQEVFDHPTFRDAASKQFVFVEFDYPQDRAGMSESLIEQNERLVKEFGIVGYPTVFLADAAGRPYAQTGYQAGGPENYLEHLAELRQLGVQLAKLEAAANAAEGIAKAEALAGVLDQMRDDLHRFYTGWMQQIIELDQDNKAGLKEKFEKRLRKLALADKQRELLARFVDLLISGDPAGALKAIVTFRTENQSLLDGAPLHELYFHEAIVLDELDQTAMAIATLQAAKSAHAENLRNEQVDEMIEDMKQRLAEGK